MKIHRHPLDFLNPIIGAWVGGEKSTFTHPAVYLSQVSVLVMIAFPSSPDRRSMVTACASASYWACRLRGLATSKFPPTGNNCAGQGTDLMQQNGCDADRCPNGLEFSDMPFILVSDFMSHDSPEVARHCISLAILA